MAYEPELMKSRIPSILIASLTATALSVAYYLVAVVPSRIVATLDLDQQETLGRLAGLKHASESRVILRRKYETSPTLVAQTAPKLTDLGRSEDAALRAVWKLSTLRQGNVEARREAVKALASLSLQAGYRETSVGGIGVQPEMNEGLFMIGAIPGIGPARTAGLREDDQIVSIDGVPTRGLPLNQGINMLRGPVGDKIALTVYRPKQNLAFKTTIHRELILFSTKDFVDAFRSALKDKDAIVRERACEGLRQLGVPAKSALPDLRVISRDQNESVRRAAHGAIESIKHTRDERGMVR